MAAGRVEAGGQRRAAAGAGWPGCPTALFLSSGERGQRRGPGEDPDSESTPKSAEARWVPEGETDWREAGAGGTARDLRPLGSSPRVLSETETYSAVPTWRTCPTPSPAPILCIPLTSGDLSLRGFPGEPQGAASGRAVTKSLAVLMLPTTKENLTSLGIGELLFHQV